MSLGISSHTPFKDGTTYLDKYYFTTKSACFIINNNGSIQADKRYRGINTLSVAPLNESVCFYGTTDGIYRNDIKETLFSSARINRLRVIGNSLVVCTQDGTFVVQLNDNGKPENCNKILDQSSYDIKRDDKYCYVKTGSGLVIFDLRDWKPVNEIYAGKYSFSINDFLMEKDTLELATNNGVYYIPKEYACKPQNIGASRLYLSCSLSGFDPSKKMSETYYSKKLAVVLSAQLLDYADQIRSFAYQISYNNDIVSNWQAVNDRTITLNNLKPGTYQITIRAEEKYAGSQNNATYTIVIHPLWYQQLWVILLFILLAASVIGLIAYKWYKIQLQQARKKMNDQLRMTELENKNLFAQLKPHFIFNVLTPLQSYFINGDDIGGLNYLNNYAKLMRGFLQESRESYITIEKEIDFLKHYLYVQQQRFSNSFVYSFEIDAQLSVAQLYIPTLILQPIVENAIEHGVKNNSELNGSIRIIIESVNNKLLVHIIDNGKGLEINEPALKPDHALEIIRERLELIRRRYGAGMLHITPNRSMSGTTIAVELPLLNTQP